MRWFMLFYTLGAIGMMVISYLLFYKNFKINLFDKWDGVSFQLVFQEFKIILPFAIITIVDNLFNTVDSLVLEANASKHELGIYFGCMKVVLGLSVFAAVANSAFLPIISEICRKPSKVGLKQLLKIFGSLILIGLGIVLTYLYFSQSIINLFYGKDFTLGYTKYSINMFDGQIALITFSRYLITIPSIYLLVSGHHLKRVYCLVILMILSTSSYLYFVPLYGIIATINIITTSNIILLLLYIGFSIPIFVSTFRNLDFVRIES